MTYWWVNQNQTYAHEVGGGYLWSPKKNQNDGRNQFYDNMTRVQPGDVVLSFSDTFIKAVGIATVPAESAPKPMEFGNAGAYWGNEGWLVQVQFSELERPLHPKSYMGLIGPTLPARYSPLQQNGNGNQGVYLAEVPQPMANVLLRLLDGQVETIVSSTDIASHTDAADDVVEKQLQQRPDIPETEKQQLIKARRGQGLFRARVELIEKSCRLTGVTQKSHLRASHIKPWRSCTDAEKLDGNNGLLLSPHVDHLFDRGFVSFSDAGDILVSSKLPTVVLERWGLNVNTNVGQFNPDQKTYLAYHRLYEFKG